MGALTFKLLGFFAHMPFGPHVLELIETALSDAIGYHSAFDNLVLRAGISRQFLLAVRDRAEKRAHGKFDRAPKRYVAQELLNEISASGGGEQVIAALVTALCNGQFPNASPSGKAAIEALVKLRSKEAAQSKDAARTRREELIEEQRVAEREKENASAERRAERERFKEEFLQLHGQTDLQARGYALERFLNGFFAFEGLDPRGSFKLVGEQIDGSFAWAGRTYLVEAKWVSKGVGGAAFAQLMYKIEGKSADTRGLFVSINGYSNDALAGLKQKGELRLVCIDGTHLFRCLEPSGSLDALLHRLWRHAGETGNAYWPATSMT